MNTSIKKKLENNKYLLLGHLTFLVLGVFSCIFVYERVLFIDSGNQVFHFIQHESFEIYDQRYSMYFFQLLPVFLIKLHAPLAVVIYSYSLSFLIIAYTLWLITVYFLKNQSIGILMLFVMLGIRQTFFHAISETFQLMFFACFLYAWLFQKRDYLSVLGQIVYYFITLLFIALCIFIHPVAIFFVLFILGMYILDKEKKNLSKIILTIISLGIILLKFLTTKEGSRDATFLVDIPAFFERLSRLLKLNPAKWFFDEMIDFYWFPLLMFVLLLIFYFKKKKYLHFVFIFCFIIGFWLISVIIYAWESAVVGLERTFLPLFFFCGLPFITEIFPLLSKKWDKVFFILLTVLIIGGFIKIAVASKPYTRRLDKMEEIANLAKKEGKMKILIELSTAEELFSPRSWGVNMLKDISLRDLFCGNNWGMGFESILYTALKGKDSIVNIYVMENQNYKEEMSFVDPDIYFGVWWWIFWPIDELSPYYFKMPKQPASLLVLEDGKMRLKDIEIIPKEE